VQPLDGSPGRQITNFKSGTFRTFSWSPDGKSLAVIRDVSQLDVVLLREVSPAQANSWRDYVTLRGARLKQSVSFSDSLSEFSVPTLPSTQSQLLITG
jgi:hypothetical protein